MGTTFSVIQVKNNNHETPTQFKRSLCKYFEKNGLTMATQEDFELSYALTFSDKSDWVTVSLPEYESDMELGQNDAAGIAKGLKTYSILTSIWDSDILSLELYGTTDRQRDTVMADRSFDDDFPMPTGNPILWLPLLIKGKTWEQVSEILNSDYVHLEDALKEMAPLLGMDAQSILSESEDLHTTTLYVKKREPYGKQSISLPVALKQSFQELLAPYGFVKIKGRHPYFVRMIGDEILHIVSYREVQTSHKILKAFQVFGAVATVYRKTIDLASSLSDNLNWFNLISEFYAKPSPSTIDDDFEINLMYFEYRRDNDDAMFYEIERALKAVKQYMLPILDKASSLEACVEYFYTMGPLPRFYEDIKDHKIYNEPFNEEFLLIKTNDHRLERITTKDIFLSTPELYAKTMEELKQRKLNNTEILRSLGLEC